MSAGPSLAGWSGTRTERRAHDGVYLILADRSLEHRLWMPRRLDEPSALAAHVPLDGLAEARMAATLRLHRHLAGDRPAEPDLTRQRRDRLTDAARALDGRLDGASYRTIATTLAGGPHVAAEPWKTSSLRDTIIRLVRTGTRLMKTGYRDLLRRR